MFPQLKNRIHFKSNLDIDYNKGKENLNIQPKIT